MYSVEAYGKMMKDTTRMEAYLEAIRRTVQPDSVVLDIGTGSGIHALMAARAGARHVFAVEPADSVLLAPAVARANELEDRITFIQDLSTRITLPEKADVVISDLHGSLPWYQQHIPTIVDARARLMKQDGVLIPQRDSVFLAAVEAPERYAVYSDPWQKKPFGFDMGAISARLTNIYARGRVGREGFLSEITPIGELDYRTVVDPNISISVDLLPLRPGTMHGFMVWFDTRVFQDVRLTSAPFEPEISYGSAFFPLSEPVVLDLSTTFHLEWRAMLQGEEYLWIWNSQVKGRGSRVLASFRQNSLAVQLTSMDRLRRRAPSHRPEPSSAGEVDRQILNLMTDGRSLQDIARDMHTRLPESFSSEEEALDRVRADPAGRPRLSSSARRKSPEVVGCCALPPHVRSDPLR